MRALIAFFQRLGRGIGWMLSSVFGSFEWFAPAWLQAIGNFLARLVERFVAAIRAQPHASAVIAGLVVVAVGGSYAGWVWYQHRPKPVEVTFSVEAPAITCYACEPQGAPQPAFVRFSDSVAPLEAVNKEIDAAKAGLELEPRQAGKWTWDDDRTLRFQPDADWPIGQDFRVAFPRRGLVAGHVHLFDDHADFRTADFEATVAGTEFYQHPVVATDKKVVVSVKFSHPVDPAAFERHVGLRLFSKVTDTQDEDLGAVAFTVVYDKPKLNASIHSSQLSVPPKEGRLDVKVQPGVQAARGGNATTEPLTSSVTVPGLNSLKLASLELQVVRDERDEPQQALLADFSFSVLEKEAPPKIRAWLLPVQHPDAQRQDDWQKFNEGEDFGWRDADLTASARKAAEALTLTPVPGELEHHELHSFRYQAEPGRYVYVKIDKGVKSFGGYVLGDTVERVLRVPQFPRELRITHQGSLLALSGSRKLDVFTRDVPAMRVDVGRLLPHQLQHLVTQTGGDFSQREFGNWSFDASNITESNVRVLPIAGSESHAAHYEPLDLSRYLAADEANRRGIFLLKVQAWDPTNDRALSNDDCSENCGELADTRLLVLTDLGIVAKNSVDGSQDVFVQSIHDGTPVDGVTVEVIGKNGQAVLTQVTGADGHVRFGDLKSFKNERQPVLYLARRGGDASFLPLDSWQRGLDFSRFDIGGIENSADKGALTAYLFSDRGLYRPGEEIRIGSIVRSQDWSRNLKDVPLQLEVTDPRGTIVRREKLQVGAAGFNEIRQATRDGSPTGNWTFALSVIRGKDRTDLIGSLDVQVREFMPDRLKLSTRFSAESADGWVKPDDLKANLNLQNLFGTPAENRRVTAEMRLSPALPRFPRYKNYVFSDPHLAREGFQESLPDTTTDERGEATLDLKLGRFEKATYRVHLVTQGFEADGGRGVAAEAAQLVSSMPFLVGYKTDGDLSFVSKDAERKVALLAIDPKAQPTEAKGLKLARIEVRFVSVLMRQGNGTYKYESRRKEITLDERDYAIPATGATLTLPTSEPGSFAQVLRDAEGQVLARVDYKVAGTANLTRSLEKNAELQITLSRPDFAPGDEIEMQIQAPYTGAGLITIERDRVYAWKWFRTDTTSSMQSIKLPPGIEGGAYINVTFVRDPASDEVFTSPLSYGVQPFSIALDARRNQITLEHPDRVKPGENFTLRYQTAKPSRIVVFAVDEGILQVARYKAPDPLGFFFQKRMLDVSTRQILDLILPEYRAQVEAAAPGGDAEGLLGKHLNPFKRKTDLPVAYWSGIVVAGPEARELSYPVPDYFNGTLRVLAVAVADDAIGVHESRAQVRGDFVLSPNAPLTVTPGDEFEVSVGVSNNVEGSGADAAVAVALAPSSHFEIVGDPRQGLNIGERRESSARFLVRVRDQLGSAELDFSASLGGKSTHRRIGLSVRPATPYRVELTAGSVRSASLDVPVTRKLYPQFRELEAGISVLPLALAHGLSAYLDNYPYSCTEQLMSQAMPAVVLGDRPEFGYVKAANGGNLAGVIAELRSRQTGDGAYRLWAGGSEVQEFVSVYAQHFLLEAAERGQAVPKDLIDAGNEHLRMLAARDGNNLEDERVAAYAIYLLTRQGNVMSAETSALRQRLEERHAKAWRTDVAAAWLASALTLMKQDGEKLIREVPFGGSAEVARYFDPMTTDGALLYLVARHFPQRLAQLPASVMDTLVERVQRGGYHSLSAATTILALDAYAKAATAASAALTAAEVSHDGKTVRPLALPAGLMPKVEFSADAGKLRFGTDSRLNAYWLVNQSGFDRSVPAEALKNGFEILHEYTDAQGRPVERVKLGSEIFVHLKYRALDAEVADIALVDLLPGGFDLVVPPQEQVQNFYQAAATQPPAESGEGEGEGEEGDYSEGSETSDAMWQCPVCVAGTNAPLTYADFREDRVVFYTWAGSGIHEIVYRIRATNAGSFVVPPAYGEALYDPRQQARSTGGRIVVEK